MTDKSSHILTQATTSVEPNIWKFLLLPDDQTLSCTQTVAWIEMLYSCFIGKSTFANCTIMHSKQVVW